MDLWRWAPVPSDLPISAGSSTSVNVLSDRQQLAVTKCLYFSEHLIEILNSYSFFDLSKIKFHLEIMILLSKNLAMDPWLPKCSKNLARACHGIQDASKRVNLEGFFEIYSKNKQSTRN